MDKQFIEDTFEVETSPDVSNTSNTGYDFYVEKKLDADDYSVSDITAATESAFGSGNLNYLMLQSQQSYEGQNILGANNVVLSDLAESVLSQGSALSSAQIGSGVGENILINNGPQQLTDTFSAANPAEGSVVNKNVVNNSGAESFEFAGGSFGGSDGSANNLIDAAVNQAINNATTVNNVTINNPDDPNPPNGPDDEPNPTGDDGPLLAVDTDTDLSETVDNLIGEAGDTIESVGDTIENVLSSDLDDLPAVLSESVVNTFESVSNIIDVTQNLTVNIFNSTTNLLEDGLDLSNPLSNVDVINNFLTDLLGDNNLEVGVDLQNTLDIDTTINFSGDIPSFDISLQVLDISPITIDSSSLTDNPLVDEIITSVDDTVENVVDGLGLSPIVTTAENAVNELLEDTSTVIDIAGDNLQPEVDGLQEDLSAAVEQLDTVVGDEVGGIVAEPLSELNEAAEDAESVLNSAQGLVEDISDITDGLIENVLPHGGEDSDVIIDGGVELGGLELPLQEEVGLDPVETIVGDVDVTLEPVVSDQQPSDIDLTADLELIDMNSDTIINPEAGGIISEGLEETLQNLPDTANALEDELATAGEAIGDALLGDEGLIDLSNDDQPAGSDSDIVANVELGLGESAEVNLLEDVDINPVEAVLGDVDINADVIADTENLSELDVQVELGDLAISTAEITDAVLEDEVLEPAVDYVLDGVGETVGDVLAGASDTVEHVLSPVQGVLGDALDGVDTVADGITNPLVDGLNSLLDQGNSGDEDLSVDVGVIAGDGTLDVVEDISLDPVESLVGDIDVAATTDLNLNDLGESGLNQTVDADVLESNETPVESIVEAVQNIVANPENAAEELATAGEAIGDALLGDEGLIDLSNDDQPAGSDSDIVANVELGLGESAEVNLLEDVDINPVEAVLGDVDINADVIADTENLSELDVQVELGDLAISTAEITDAVLEDEVLEPAVDYVLDGVGETVGDVLAGASDTVEHVLSPVQGVLGDALDGVDTVADGITNPLVDGLNSLLDQGNSGDEDLSVDVGVIAGDGTLDVVEDISLDPVESLVGDIDVAATTDLNLNELDAFSLNEFADISLLEPQEGDLLVNDLSESTMVNPEESLIAGESAFGDVLVQSDNLVADVSSYGEVLGDCLPEPIGNVNSGLSEGQELADLVMPGGFGFHS